MPTTHRIHLKQVLAQRQKELAAAQSLVGQLSEQCLHLRREINESAPIMLLPLELKMDIFCLSKLEDSNDHPPIALLLASVCSEWRKIVLNMPQLWDTIRIPFYNKTTDRYMELNQTKLSTLQEWLARGQQCPLSIQVVLRNDEWEESPRFLAGESSRAFFLEAIMQQSHRWKHISLHNAIPDDFRHKVFREPRDLKLLHSLCIRGPSYDCRTVGEEPIIISTFSNAPALRKAEISGFTVSEEITLPWDQLEKLDGIGDLHDVYDVLRQGHNLIDCEFSTEDWWEGLNRLQRTTVPKLQRLTLYGFTEFSRVLDLPSLMYLKHSTYPDGFSFDEFSGLIEYSSCPLKDLTISAHTLAGFMHCMRLLPSLTTLDISSTNGALSAYFFERLAEDDDTLLPNLEVLEYQGNTEFHFGTLLAMLRQRHRNQDNSVSQLEWVHIRSANDIPGCDEAAIEELETFVNLEEGLELDIKVWNSGSCSWQDIFVSD